MKLIRNSEGFELCQWETLLLVSLLTQRHPGPSTQDLRDLRKLHCFKYPPFGLGKSFSKALFEMLCGYQRESRMPWSPADHRCTLSFQHISLSCLSLALLWNAKELKKLKLENCWETMQRVFAVALNIKIKNIWSEIQLAYLTSQIYSSAKRDANQNMKDSASYLGKTITAKGREAGCKSFCDLKK